MDFKAKRAILVFTTLVALTTSLTCPADDIQRPPRRVQTAPVLNEAFVEFRVTKTRGSGFYRVMVDEQERPYIDVGQALSHWLDMKPDCQMPRLYCQADMPGTQQKIWIDGEQGQMAGPDSTVIELAPGELVVQEQHLWLRYDAWPRWLPITTDWTLYTYTLGFHPNFPLLQDLKTAREKQRRQQLSQRSEREMLRHTEPVTPAEPYRAEGRYRVVLGRSDREDSDESEFSYEGVADAWQGTLRVAGSAAAGDEHLSPDFWRYRQLRRPHYYLLDVGYTQSDTSILFPVFLVKDGVRFNRLETSEGAGEFEYTDHTQPGTEIDVLRNGFYQQTLVADADGFYQIDRLFVSGGDRITLRYYFQDGSRAEKIIQIAPDGGQIIAKGQYDVQLLSGKLVIDDSPVHRAGVRYGLTDNLSGGLHAFQFDNAGQPDTLMKLDLAWRPFYGLNLLYEQLNSEDSRDYVARADLTALPGQHVRIDWRELADNSPLLNFPYLRDPARSLHTVAYDVRVSRWSLFTEYKSLDDAWNSSLNLDYRLSNRFGLFYENATQRAVDDQMSRENHLGLVMMPRQRQFIEARRSWLNGQNSWSVTYRHQGGLDNPWDVSVLTTRTVDNELNFSGAVTWRASRKLSLSLTSSKEATIAYIAWQDVISTSPGPRYWDEFATGTLTGRVVAPATAAGKSPQPLANVRVRADIKTAMTDKYGYYEIHGIPSNQRVVVYVDKNSLDATLAPVEEKQVLYFRPGTRIHYDPELTWTAGLDGYLETAELLPPGVAIDIIRDSDQKLIATVPVEEDGFFLAEGLTPGHYMLNLTGVDHPPAALAVDLTPETDWLSDLRWAWPAGHGKANN